jgi:hypothetical protein
LRQAKPRTVFNPISGILSAKSRLSRGIYLWLFTGLLYTRIVAGVER